MGCGLLNCSVISEDVTAISKVTSHYVCSVCAEAFNPDEDDEDTEPRVVHPKTDEQRCRLQEACRDILLFKTLDQVGHFFYIHIFTCFNFCFLCLFLFCSYFLYYFSLVNRSFSDFDSESCKHTQEERHYVT